MPNSHHRCKTKKTFFTFFILVTFLRFSTFFYFPNVFLFLKKRWQSSERQEINKKHFQNNSNEINHDFSVACRMT